MISIEEQAAAVEISAVNLRGHVENMAYLVERGRRSKEEYRLVSDRLPALEAASKTLRWMVSREEIIKKAVT